MISEFELRGNSYPIIPSYQDGAIQFEIEGTVYTAELKEQKDGSRTTQQMIKVNGKSHRIWLAYDDDQIFIHADGRHWTVIPIDPLEQATANAGGVSADNVTAPMPGTVISLSVSVGDSVKKNDLLIVIESMKMETSLVAPRDGVIDQVHFEKGARFDKNAILITLQKNNKEKNNDETN